MKKIIFLVHDPGGHDALFPIVSKCKKEGIAYEFFCTGSSARLSPEYYSTSEDALNTINWLANSIDSLCLITGTSWGNEVELKAIDMFKKASKLTFSILDYWANYSTRFKLADGRLIYPDYYIIMDDLALQEAILEGVPPEILHVLGHPGLDSWINLCQPGHYRKNKFNILFLSQPLFDFYGNALGFSEREVLEDMIELIRAMPKFTLSIKFHPKESTFIKNKYSNFSIEGSLQVLLPRFETVIGMNTMGLLQSVLLGTDTISYQPNICVPDDCITNKLGLTTKLTSYDELMSYMSRERIPTSSIKENKENYIWLDGKSTNRVFEFIKGVLQL